MRRWQGNRGNRRAFRVDRQADAAAVQVQWHILVSDGIAILVIAEQRTAELRQMHADLVGAPGARPARSEEHTSELQSLMRISYAVFCLKKKKQNKCGQV